MGDEVNNSFSKEQKNVIYREMLAPLKLKISQILLYDTDAALEFLQEYNEIVKNEDSFGNHIIEQITELEFKIQNYMSKEGKEKAFQERSKAILQSIENLRINSIQLSLKDFESEFAKLKADYEENIENYSFEDRDKIEREIYALQASLIMRQVASGKTADELQQTITEQDKVGLNIFVAEQINMLRQKDGLKDIADKVNNIVMTDNNAVLNPKLWSWLDATEKGIKRDEQSQMIQPINSTAMIVAPKNKNITLMDRISKVFSKEPTFPLEISDLKKINIEWLSKYIPKSMLMELENDRLREENRQVDERYVPDPRCVIHKFICGVFEKRSMETPNVQEYELLIENGSKFKMKVIEGYEDLRSIHLGVRQNLYVEVNAGNIAERTVLKSWEDSYRYDRRYLNGMLSYAGFLDRIFNSDFQQQLLKEIKDVYIDETTNKIPIYHSLWLGWRPMTEERVNTQLELAAMEEAKRKQFYEKNSFREQLKHQNTKDGVEEEIQDENEIITQHGEHNGEGQEQGG